MSSEDEFEKEMDSEALATLKLMVSPTAAAEAVRGHVTRTTSTSSGGGGRDDTVVVTRDGKKKARASGRVSRRRRGSTEQGKTVRFALESKTEDELSGGGRTGKGSSYYMFHNNSGNHPPRPIYLTLCTLIFHSCAKL